MINNVRLFPSLLAWSAVPLTDSEAEFIVLETVSEADLAMFLSNESVGHRWRRSCYRDVRCSVHFEWLKGE